MKLLTIMAVLAAFTSPALADITKSKAGAALCAKNEADHAVALHVAQKAVKSSSAAKAK